MNRKHFTLIARSLFLSSLLTPAQTNLIHDWNAQANVGTGSTPSDAGWQCVPLGTYGWTDANGSSGCRFGDYNVTGGYTGYTDKSGADSTFKKRIMYIRWDAGNGSSYFTYPVVTSLEWSSPSQSKTIIPESALYNSTVSVPKSAPNTTNGFFFIVCKNDATREFEIQLPGTFKYFVFSSSGQFDEEGFATSGCKVGVAYPSGTFILQIKQRDIAA